MLQDDEESPSTRSTTKSIRTGMRIDFNSGGLMIQAVKNIWGNIWQIQKHFLSLLKHLKRRQWDTIAILN